MIHIQNIFDKKPVSVKRRDEEFVDPFTDTFPHRYGFPWLRGAMASHNDAGWGQSLISLQPPTIKQLNHLIAIHTCHTRCWGMSQYTLDLRMLQDLISSCSGDKIHTSFK